MSKSIKGLTALSLASAVLLPLGAATPADAATGPHHFANCTAMHRVFPHGVGLFGAHDHVSSGSPVTNFKRAPRWYWKNTSLDRDHDHVACEKH